MMQLLLRAHFSLCQSSTAGLSLPPLPALSLSLLLLCVVASCRPVNERMNGWISWLYCDGTGREAVARVQDKAGHRSIWAGSRPYLVRVPTVARPTSRPPRTERLRLSGGARSWTRTLEQGID